MVNIQEIIGKVCPEAVFEENEVALAVVPDAKWHTVAETLKKAGYDWLGAEQMYGPEEIILSSLRGASRAYSRPLYGTLHAMQWGSGPFTDPKHSLRLYMSLAVAYMHGSSHMNTEEALWTDEYMNDRYSVSARNICLPSIRC